MQWSEFIVSLENKGCDFVCTHCTSTSDFKVMPRNFLNIMGIFGTPVSVIMTYLILDLAIFLHHLSQVDRFTYFSFLFHLFSPLSVFHITAVFRMISSLCLLFTLSWWLCLLSCYFDGTCFLCCKKSLHSFIYPHPALLWYIFFTIPWSVPAANFIIHQSIEIFLNPFPVLVNILIVDISFILCSSVLINQLVSYMVCHIQFKTVQSYFVL